MEPKFKKVSEMNIVGMSTRFISVIHEEKNNMVVIPALWKEFMPRIHEIKSSNPRVSLGVCFDIPEEDRNHPGEMLYVAACEVLNFENVPAGMETYTVAGGEYAIFTHKGPIDSFENTMGYIFGIWLPKSQKKLRDAPTMEFYDHRFDPLSKDSEIDIYVPIE